ncbi:MAG: exodeoxyribonuclease VII small subunit [Pyramidobacter sp.]|nr:exodeoxyribonuclease VII small subunit [Pyramidobacter sp.]
MEFSKKMERLEEILRTMERAALPLEDTLALYEEGKKIAAECREFLRQAEGKVSILEQDGTLRDFPEQEER